MSWSRPLWVNLDWDSVLPELVFLFCFVLFPPPGSESFLSFFQTGLPFLDPSILLLVFLDSNVVAFHFILEFH